jgi:hypothetical protein
METVDLHSVSTAKKYYDRVTTIAAVLFVPAVTNHRYGNLRSYTHSVGSLEGYILPEG